RDAPPGRRHGGRLAVPRAGRRRRARSALLHPEPGRSGFRDLSLARRARQRYPRSIMSDDILDHLRHRVLLADGGMGTRVQGWGLPVEPAFTGHETCTGGRRLPRPDLVREAQEASLAAGADMVETNPFGATPVTLGEFGISPQAYEINRRAGEIAREAAELFK